jgi:hypothetical protein
MTRNRLLSGLIALVAVLATAPAASADDAGLFNAYNARQAEVDNAADQYTRAFRRALRNSTTRAWRRIIRANDNINVILTTIKSELAAQTASSARGRRARTQALREVRWWRRANNFESQAIREGLRGHRTRSRRMFRRSDRTILRAGSAGRRAVRHFKAVGLTSPLGPISIKAG